MIEEIDGSYVYYIYKKSHLAKDGWLQLCLACNTITSHTKFYKKITCEPSVKAVNYYMYLCPYCSNEFDNSTEKQNKIKKKIIFLFKNKLI